MAVDHATTGFMVNATSTLDWRMETMRTEKYECVCCGEVYDRYDALQAHEREDHAPEAT